MTIFDSVHVLLIKNGLDIDLDNDRKKGRCKHQLAIECFA